MANGARISFTGNLTADAELRFTPSGAAVANFTVAVTARKKQGDEWIDGDTAFYRCAVWRQMGENVAESLTRGTRVVVTGELEPREYESNGNKGLSLDVNVDSVGPDLRYATAKVTKAERGGSAGNGDNNNGGGGGGFARASGPQQNDPWASSAGGFGGGGDAPPF